MRFNSAFKGLIFCLFSWQHHCLMAQAAAWGKWNLVYYLCTLFYRFCEC